MPIKVLEDSLADETFSHTSGGPNGTTPGMVGTQNKDGSIPPKFKLKKKRVQLTTKKYRKH